jgi:hypothetical protein
VAPQRDEDEKEEEEEEEEDISARPSHFMSTSRPRAGRRMTGRLCNTTTTPPPPEES